MKNPALALITLIIYSFFIGLNDRIYAVYFIPILLFVILKKEFIISNLKKLVILNLFVVIVALNPLINGNYQLALLVFLRCNLIIFFTILLFSGTDDFFIVYATKNIFGKKLSILIYFTIRFIDSLKSEFFRLKKTLKARLFLPKTSLFTYKIYANLTAMLFLSAYENAVSLEKTLRLRGFYPKYMIKNRDNRLFKRDILIFAIIMLSLSLKFGALV